MITTSRRRRENATEAKGRELPREEKDTVESRGNDVEGIIEREIITVKDHDEIVDNTGLTELPWFTSDKLQTET